MNHESRLYWNRHAWDSAVGLHLLEKGIEVIARFIIEPKKKPSIIRKDKGAKVVESSNRCSSSQCDLVITCSKRCKMQ